eukprot:COSAG01_NODE_11545_length_1907_cov_1.316372_4_plen_56_part_00
MMRLVEAAKRWRWPRSGSGSGMERTICAGSMRERVTLPVAAVASQFNFTTRTDAT